MVKKTKNVDEHICSECINSFKGKDIFTAQVPNRKYYTNYCAKCIKKLKITDFEPYIKEKVVKETIKISEVRKWLEKMDNLKQNKLSKKYFNKNIDNLSVKQLRELYKNEKINNKL